MHLIIDKKIIITLELYFFNIISFFYFFQIYFLIFIILKKLKEFIQKTF